MSGPAIAITGAGAVASLGRTRRELWEAICAGRCGCGPAPDIESGPVPPTGAAQAVGLPVDFAPQLERESRYLRWVAAEALREAGLTAPGPDPSRRAALVGTTLHGIRAGGRWLRGAAITELARVQAPLILRDALAGLGVEGPRLTTCAACASGLTSLSVARAMLQAGQIDVALAGGYDPISEYASAGFASLRLVASGPQRPFCRDREGLKVAEGYAMLTLERLDDALARGAEPLALLAGVGETSDGRHLTQPHPEGIGAARAVTSALREAGLTPEAIGLICAHATGTPANDGAEAAALHRALGAAAASTPITACKSHLGHTLGAAGAVELAVAIEAMRAGAAPPLANVRREDVEFTDLDIVTEAPRPAPIKATLSLSLGFGGSNAALAMTQSGGTAAAGRAAERAVVITGAGVLLPGVTGMRQFDELTGRDPIEARADLGTPDPEAYQGLLDPRRARRLSEYSRLGVAAATMALEMADVGDRGAFCSGCDAVLGTTHGAPGYSEAYYREIVESGPEAANPMLFAEGVPNAGAAQLSICLSLHGACQTILGSRTAGLEALHVAALRIASGRTERAIVSASEECAQIVADAYRACGLLGDDGFFLAGGAVALVLESASSARDRGAAPLARVQGSALGTAGDLSPEQFAASARDVIGSLAGAGEIMHAASGSWLDIVERRAADLAGRRVRSGLPWTNIELASVGPLAVLAGQLGAGGPASTVCVDFHGGVATASLGAPER